MGWLGHFLVLWALLPFPQRSPGAASHTAAARVWTLPPGDSRTLPPGKTSRDTVGSQRNGPSEALSAQQALKVQRE